MHQWDHADHEQARDQEPDPDIHERFDHHASCTTINPDCYQNTAGGSRSNPVQGLG
jgi:inorganic pyrophosphatase/exopolyphosphatase